MNEPLEDTTSQTMASDFLVDLLRREILDIQIASTGAEDDPDGSLPLQDVLILVTEESAVIGDVLAEVDFILAQTPPLTPRQQARILQGADRGVQLAANRHLDPDEAVQELREVVDTIRGQRVSGGPADEFVALVELVANGETPCFEDYDAATVANWIIELSAPSATLFNILAPGRDGGREQSGPLPMPVGSAVNAWADFAHDVLALVDAQKSRALAAAEQRGQAQVDQRDEERPEGQNER
ncbi:hypothetical protein [uncultured Nocardioides sp.]|uniref:hypothetical protein n=1 Tax=uncultured Nocardioides sp. TaxID=198441 RepID=UPI002639B499|nr:hypothetical protein [uncultured Nocardioides sp.]